MGATTKTKISVHQALFDKIVKWVRHWFPNGKTRSVTVEARTRNTAQALLMLLKRNSAEAIGHPRHPHAVRTWKANLKYEGPFGQPCPVDLLVTMDKLPLNRDLLSYRLMVIELPRNARNHERQLWGGDLSLEDEFWAVGIADQVAAVLGRELYDSVNWAAKVRELLKANNLSPRIHHEVINLPITAPAKVICGPEAELDFEPVEFEQFETETIPDPWN